MEKHILFYQDKELPKRSDSWLSQANDNKEKVFISPLEKKQIKSKIKTKTKYYF